MIFVAKDVDQLVPLRAAYTRAELSESDYRIALRILAEIQGSIGQETAILKAYGAALHGIGALYTDLPWEQFRRVTDALRELNALTTQIRSSGDPLAEAEFCFVRASFGKGLPPVFLAETWVRSEEKRLLRLLEEYGAHLPVDLTRLAHVFLKTRTKLSFPQADRLRQLERQLGS